jgi:hypothetical protein
VVVQIGVGVDVGLKELILVDFKRRPGGGSALVASSSKVFYLSP